ncbi:MAG TPA: hypothetical protein VEB42_02080, partial [Chitinophagaceae bacterium]|nr:hypothetical protein [Chitinophagaceae bacterium]
SSLDVPVVGSFENNTGYFYAKDNFEGKPVLIQFKWDATDPGRPVWSQAFSMDKGETWEWNWFMYFSKDRDISVLEIRNYLLKPGARETFIKYFQDNFIESQNQLGGYVLGQYRVKGFEDNFCWFRGYADMASRSKYLPAFYHGFFWKERRSVANSMLLNNDNVYLLKPVAPGGSVKFKIAHTGITVIDLYIANGKLDKLIDAYFRKCIPVLEANGITDYSVWTSELTGNDFPALPVFQDKNLMVTITFYKDELEYAEKMRLPMDDELHDIITIKNTLILYPTNEQRITFPHHLGTPNGWY